MFNVYSFVEKPWGSETWIALNDKYCLKIIKINKGHKTSLQFHNSKRETNYISEGRAKVFYDGKEYELEEGATVDILPGVVHRFEALTDLVLVEASTPEVQDVVRIKDCYGRKGT